MFSKNGIPLYVQLKEKLLQDIKENYKVGDIIPTEAKLENQYKISRITVRKAIEQLEQDNIIEKKQGKGTFVKEQKILYDAKFNWLFNTKISKTKLYITNTST